MFGDILRDIIASRGGQMGGMRAQGYLNCGQRHKLNAMGNMIRAGVLVSLTLLLASAASAQTGQNYNVKTMNFDMWCQEQAHLPADRCDKRTAEDEKTFEDYRTKIERYEVPYLQQQQHDLAIRRDVMQNDPVDNPVGQNPQAQTQDPNRQPSTPQP